MTKKIAYILLSLFYKEDKKSFQLILNLTFI